MLDFLRPKDKQTKRARSIPNVNNTAVARAILAIYKGQTQDEQCVGQTVERNGIGFNAFHASTGTYIAKWLLKGNPLSGKWVEKARKIALFHVPQLVRIANGNG